MCYIPYVIIIYLLKGMFLNKLCDFHLHIIRLFNLNSHTDEHNQFPIELCITSSVLHYNNLNEKKIWYQMLIHSKSYQKNMAFVCQICSCFQVTTIKCKWHSPCTYHSNNSSTISRGITLFLYFFYHFLKTVIYTGPWLRLCNFTGPI